MACTCDLVLSGVVGQSAAHIHGPASYTGTGDVIVPLPVGSFSKFMVSFTLAQSAAVVTEQSYFNVHTAAFLSGEIRGQIIQGLPGWFHARA